MTEPAHKSLNTRPAACHHPRKTETTPSGCSSSSVAPPASKQCLPASDSEFLQSVHDLGAYPRRFKNPVGDAQCQENALAKKIQTHWQKLSKGTQQELLDLKAKNAQSSEEDRVETLMTAVRTFGRWPKEHAVTEDPKLEEERKLAHDIRKALDAARLPPVFVSELEAMKARAEEETIDEVKRGWGGSS